VASYPKQYVVVARMVATLLMYFKANSLSSCLLETTGGEWYFGPQWPTDKKSHHFAVHVRGKKLKLVVDDKKWKGEMWGRVYRNSAKIPLKFGIQDSCNPLQGTVHKITIGSCGGMPNACRVQMKMATPASGTAAPMSQLATPNWFLIRGEATINDTKMASGLVSQAVCAGGTTGGLLIDVFNEKIAFYLPASSAHAGQWYFGSKWPADNHPHKFVVRVKGTKLTLRVDGEATKLDLVGPVVAQTDPNVPIRFGIQDTCNPLQGSLQKVIIGTCHQKLLNTTSTSP